jgi:hypothetical protein
MNMKKNSRKKYFLEFSEDFVLGFLACARDSKSDPSDYLDIKEVLKRVKSVSKVGEQ